MRIKGMSEREFIMLFAAVLIGRVHLIGMNPFAVGFFMAMCYERVSKGFFMVALSLGIWNAYGFVIAVKYVIVFLLCGFLCGIMEKRKTKTPLIVYSGIGAISLLFVEYIWNRIQFVSPDQTLLVLLESVLAGVFTQILYIGIHYILMEKRAIYAGNEELISVMVLGCLLVFGVPFQKNMQFGILEFCLSVLILVAGYRYGAGAGSLAGAISGLFFLARDSSFEMLGILALLGMGAGVFRELGRVVSAITYVGIYLAAGVYINGIMLSVGRLRAVILAGILFAVLPKKMIKKVETMALDKDYAFLGMERMEKQIKGRLSHFSEPFFALSRTFSKMSQQKETMEEQDMEEILQQVTNNLCSGCEKANRCLGFTRHEKYQTASCILPAAKEHGYIEVGDFPVNFANKCDYLDSYVAETNQALRLVSNNVRWQNRLAESREAIAEQFQDIGFLLKDFSQELFREKELELDKKKDLAAVLKRNQILVRQIEKVETNKHCQEIHLLAKARGRGCITTRELAKCVSNVLDKSFVPIQGSKNVLSRDYEKVILVEDTKFKTITGVARCSKEGEVVCGDNYSFLKLDSGELVMTLADGMGSGTDACMESTSAVELMESFLEAGVGEKTAIRLINSIFVLQSEEERLSTLDMVIINLYTGICDFIKMGAATAFIKREDRVEMITSASLPMGIFSKADYEDVSKKLYNGDMVILLSDGVLEAAPMVHKERYVIELLSNLKTENPTEIANTLLQHAIVNSGGEIVDDMTVLVAGVWMK